MNAPNRSARLQRIAVLLATFVAAATSAHAESPAQIRDGYARLAGAPPQAARGQQFFGSRHGSDWSCSSCHGSVPTVTGKHASTGKAIQPLAPAVNAERFSNPTKVEKWFRRNCNDVVGRECTAAEKADVLAWLLTLKP